MGCGKSGRLRLIPAVFFAVLLLCAGCAGSADDRDQSADGADIAQTADTQPEPAVEAPAPEPDAPDRPSRDGPQIAGGYTATDVNAEIVVESAAFVQAALGDGLTALIAAAEAGSLQLDDASAAADCEDSALELGEVAAAATQVVAGRNVWLTADYSCSEVAGILSAIVYWDLEREPRLTDLDLEFTVGDFSPVDQ